MVSSIGPHFYTDYGRTLQKSFFDFYLKGEDNGWQKRDRVQLQVRHIDHFEERTKPNGRSRARPGPNSISMRIAKALSSTPPVEPRTRRSTRRATALPSYRSR